VLYIQQEEYLYVVAKKHQF